MVSCAGRCRNARVATACSGVDCAAASANTPLSQLHPCQHGPAKITTLVNRYRLPAKRKLLLPPAFVTRVPFTPMFSSQQCNALPGCNLSRTDVVQGNSSSPLRGSRGRLRSTCQETIIAGSLHLLAWKPCAGTVYAMHKLNAEHQGGSRARLVTAWLAAVFVLLQLQCQRLGPQQGSLRRFGPCSRSSRRHPPYSMLRSHRGLRQN